MLGRARTPAAPQVRETARPTQIADNGANAFKSPKAKPAPQKTKAEITADYIKACEARYGTNMPPGLKTHLYYLKHPPEKIYQASLSYPYLKHTSERDIASVLLVQLGTQFLEPMEYGEQFDQDFLAAMTDPIEIEADDSEDVRHEKELIQKLKKEIAALVKETGKKPSELMTEQSKMMFEIGRFEQQLGEDLRAAESNPDLTDQEVADMFAAANVMRKKKGLDEQPIPDLTRRTLALKRQQRREAREQKRKALESQNN